MRQLTRSNGNAGSLDLTGGDSVYCINQAQLGNALELAENHPESAPRIQQALESLEKQLSRNERAALAFVLIERLRTGPE